MKIHLKLRRRSGRTVAGTQTHDTALKFSCRRSQMERKEIFSEVSQNFSVFIVQTQMMIEINTHQSMVEMNRSNKRKHHITLK